MDWLKRIFVRDGRNMSIQITHLGSGSRGNSTLLSSSGTNVLIDCGFSMKQTEKRLEIIGIEPEKVDSIVITHHHKDHSGSALQASKKWESDLHCNLETSGRMGWIPTDECKIFANLEMVEISPSLRILAIPVPHDDADNVGVVASDGRGNRAAIVTDLGEATHELKSHLRGCNHISIEANYDHSRLINGHYPDSLKRRISGRGGHLSNVQTSEILREICNENLESLVLCHLSEKNNAPHLAESEVLMSIGEEFSGDIAIYRQIGPELTHWTGQSEPENVVVA